MRMQIFRVKKCSCKILKTKNCVLFEVQYYSKLGLSLYTFPYFVYASKQESGETVWLR